MLKRHIYFNVHIAPFSSVDHLFKQKELDRSPQYLVFKVLNLSYNKYWTTRTSVTEGFYHICYSTCNNYNTFCRNYNTSVQEERENYEQFYNKNNIML